MCSFKTNNKDNIRSMLYFFSVTDSKVILATASEDKSIRFYTIST
jgi:hypothetical protein